MREIMSEAIRLLRAGERACVVTLLSCKGSAPRGAGASMLVGADGLACGTVGGGTIEYEAIKRARAALEDGVAAVEAYSLAPGDAAGLGMVCGGSVTALIQPLDASALPVLERMHACALLDQPVWLSRVIQGGRVEMALIECGAGLSREPVYGQGCFVQPVIPPGRALVYGGGHVAAALVPLLRTLDFAVTVFEDRDEFAAPDRFPGARVTLRPFEGDCVNAGDEDFIVIMTRGHQHDYAILRRALKTGARYIGCIGSRGKVALARAQLEREGFTQEDIARVRAPIGLAIGARTPAEIAVSIAAQMIACRSGVPA